MIATLTLLLLQMTVFSAHNFRYFFWVLNLFQVVGQRWLVLVLWSIHLHKILGSFTCARTLNMRRFMHFHQWLWNLSGVAFIFIAYLHLIRGLLLRFRFFKFYVAHSNGLLGVRRNLWRYRGLKHLHGLDIKDGFRFGVWVGRLLVLDHINR